MNEHSFYLLMAFASFLAMSFFAFDLDPNFRLTNFIFKTKLALCIFCFILVIVLLFKQYQHQENFNQQHKESYYSALKSIKFHLTKVEDVPVTCTKRHFGYIEEQSGKHTTTHLSGSIKFSGCSTGKEYVLVNYAHTPSCFDTCLRRCDFYGCTKIKETSAKECVDNCYQSQGINPSKEGHIQYSKI